MREKLGVIAPHEHGFRRMFRWAAKHGLIRDAGFELFKIPSGPDYTVLEGAAGRKVGSYVEFLAEVLPDFRNDLAHGSTTLHEGSPMTLLICADLINQIFRPTGVAADPARA